MPGQILELLFLAAIAFIIINRLISLLGTTSDDDPTKNSYFGEPSNIKDITETNIEQSNHNGLAGRFLNKKSEQSIDLGNLIDANSDKNKITQGITELSIKMPNFKIDKFIKGAKAAFRLIIESKNTPAQLQALVDKRFIEKFGHLSDSYGKLLPQEPDVKLSDVYNFGNNVFIKVMISGYKIIDNIDDFKEEWTFSKNMHDNSPGWYLNNVERLLV